MVRNTEIGDAINMTMVKCFVVPPIRYKQAPLTSGLVTNTPAATADIQ